PIGARGAIIYEVSGPALSTDPEGTPESRGQVPVYDNTTLIDVSSLPKNSFHDLLSLADFFDPQNPYLDKVKGGGASGSSGAASFSSTGAPAPRAASAASDAIDAIRKVLSAFFSDTAM